MIPRLRIILLLFSLSVLQPFSPSALSAQSPLALTGPEVVKLDWGTRSLQVADLNGDGLPDIAVANNDRSTIELLYQLKPGEPPPRVPASLSPNRWEPVVEDARFRKATITTGVVMFDLCAGDLNGDKLPDLVHTGSPQALTLRLQQADGSWVEKKIPEAPAPNQLVGSLKIADLDGDGRADLAMLGKNELAVFYQTDGGALAAPERYTLPDNNCYGLEVCDVDGDGLADLVYLCNGARQTVRVRLQTPSRQFGPELSYEIKHSRCTLQILQQADAKTGRHAIFAFAQDGTGQLEEFTLKPGDASSGTVGFQPGATPLPSLNPRIFSPRPGAKTPAAYAIGNFTAEPKPRASLPQKTSSRFSGPDIVVSDPDAAQIYLYARQPDGGFTTAKKSPVFSDARALAAGDWYDEGRDALFIGSPKEQAVGVSRHIDGRFEYPKPLPVTGRPLDVAYGDFDGLGQKLLAVLLENKGKRSIELWSRDGDTAKLEHTIPITNLKTDPRALRLLDANQDGKLDIAVFTPLDAMRLYVQGDGLEFTEASADSGFRRSLVDKLESSALTLGDIDGDGKHELVTAHSGFARALRLDASGGLQVIEQFNARDPNTEVAAVLAIPDAPSPVTASDWQKPGLGATVSQSKTQGPKPRITVVLYDRKSEQFQILRPDGDGLYQIVDTIPAGKIEVTGAEVLPSTNEAFIFGRDRFWWLPLGRRDFAASTLSTHTTDLPGISYADIIAGDLVGDGRPEIICVDPAKNLLEILRRDAGGMRWDSVMHFKVFEIDQHYQGRRGGQLEPRETVIADITGDGKKSILLLVHDRLLIYPQE
ncbi:hypothetical protein M2447_001545 [Ereboglobus sp. PH5-10]|uniref:FG-GAP repeat domain-containing protein n=1 Tax=Ereboglobus sp. PH5-10 TaxID=2940629 RepID=UPI0024065118|nr:VCBS repeat-containing protein [Ereboglobus sp. PH5-10]MDF9827452.1 hypothetical protein [Ereboglobus sp. PH5-10]